MTRKPSNSKRGGKRIKRGWADLTAEEKRLCVLYICDELSLPQVAERVGKSTSYVKNLLYCCVYRICCVRTKMGLALLMQREGVIE